MLIVSIAANLAAIIYFKYTKFFLGIFIPEHDIPEFVRVIVLPLAISFFTFQQIAYLVDIWRGQISVGRFSLYALFVSFFPQLIAGPIVRYQQIVPQYEAMGLARRLLPRLFIVGVTLFIIGLGKKVLIADSLSPYVGDVFKFAARGYPVGFYDAWIGALGYTFQLYFDFSGYSDMAIGLGLMMGFRLPVNFFSPYKSLTIVEFWRRWHISLSVFFRDYLYIPLGGGRKGPWRQMLNLMVVMALVGLWHGAGWTFVIWGVYHGVLLVVTHLVGRGWDALRGARIAFVDRIHQRIASSDRFRVGVPLLSWLVTFVLVVLGWVLFRATSLDEAMAIYQGMSLVNGPWGYTLALLDIRLYPIAGLLIVGAAIIALAFPNAVELIRRLHRVVDSGELVAVGRASVINMEWRLSYGYAILLGVLTYFAITTVSNVSTEFLYFNF